MTLTTQEREQVHRGIMRHWSRLRENVQLSKPDLFAAVVATDAWIEGNQSGFNTSLPPPARNNLTSTQKTLLFLAVAACRVSVSFARQLFGEVD